MNINQIGQKKKRQAVRRLSQGSPAGQPNRKEDIRRKLEAKRLASSRGTRGGRGGRRKSYRGSQDEGPSHDGHFGPYKYRKGITHTIGIQRKHVSPLVNTDTPASQETSSTTEISHKRSTLSSKSVSEKLETSKKENVFGSNLFKKKAKKETVFVGSPFKTVANVDIPTSSTLAQNKNSQDVFGSFMGTTSDNRTATSNSTSDSKNFQIGPLKQSEKNIFMSIHQEKMPANIFGASKSAENTSNNSASAIAGNVAKTVAKFEQAISQSSDTMLSNNGNVFKATIFPQVSDTFKDTNIGTQQQNNTPVFGQSSLPKTSNTFIPSSSLSTTVSKSRPALQGSVFGSAGLPTNLSYNSGLHIPFSTTNAIVAPSSTSNYSALGSAASPPLSKGTGTSVFPTNNSVFQASVFGGAALPSSSSTGLPVMSTGLTGQASMFGSATVPARCSTGITSTSQLFIATKGISATSQKGVFGNTVTSLSFTRQTGQESEKNTPFPGNVLTSGSSFQSSPSISYLPVNTISSAQNNGPSGKTFTLTPQTFPGSVTSSNQPIKQPVSLFKDTTTGSTNLFAPPNIEFPSGVLPQQIGTDLSAGRGPSPKSTLGRKRSVSTCSADLSEVTSIVVKGLTKEYMDKTLLTNDFSTFGKVIKVSVQPTKEQVIITFDSHESAKKAKSKALELFPLKDIGVYWCKRKRTNSGRTLKTQSEERGLRERNKKELALRKISIANALRSVDPSSFPPSQNALERFNVLDEIDKIIRQAIKPYTDLATAPTIVGVCPDMCPEKERYMREDRINLSVFEMLPGTQDNRDGDVPRVDHSRAVTEYSRSAADKLEPLAHEIRPVNVLQMTMDYLAANVMDNGEGRWGEWFNFLWDRTRAIRKDITQQHLCNVECADLVEKITRFHIFCAHYLCEEDMHSFDTKINNENLTKCLQTLKQIYEDLYRDKGIVCSKESEFQAYDILLNLNEGDTLRKAMQYRPEVRNSVEVKFALDVFSSLNSNNYVRFFKLLKSASYLNACIMHRYFTQVRSSALETMTRAYRDQELYPLNALLDIFALEDKEEAKNLCEHYELVTSNDCVQLSKVTFVLPEKVFPLRRAKNVIETKRNCSIGEVVSGCALEPLANHEPLNSFDSNGRYIGLPKLSQLLGEITEETPEPETPDYYSELDGSLSFTEIIQPTQVVDSVDHLRDEILTQAIQHTGGSLVGEAVDGLVKNICEDAIYEAKLILAVSAKCADQVLRKFLPVFLREIATQCISKELKLKRERIAENESKKRVSVIILDEILNDVVRTEVVTVARDARRETERRMRAQSFVKMSAVIMNEITERILFDQCRDIASSTRKEMVKEKKTMLWKLAKTLFKSRLKRHFQRWSKEYRTAVRIRNILVHIPAKPPILTSQQQVDRLFNNNVTSSESRTSISPHSSYSSLITERAQLQEHLDEMVKEQELRRLRSKEPVDVLKAIWDLENNDFGSDGMKEPNRNRTLKLVISLPGCSSPNSSSVVEEIIKSKFRKVTEDDKPRLTIPTALKTKVETLSCYTLKTNKILRSTRQLQIDIKALTGVLSNDNLLLVQDSNLFLGLTGVVLVLNSTARDKDDMFWTSSRTRLREILKSKPRVPGVPLVIFNFYDLGPTDESVIEEQLNLGYFIDEGLVAEWIVHQSHETVLPDELHGQLAEVIQWLVCHCPLIPPMECKSLKIFVESEVLKLFTIPLCEEIALRKHAQLQPQCPEVIIELYNAVIDHLISVITNNALQDISWPIPEFLHSSTEDIPSVSWNSSNRFQDLHNILEKLKLPPPPSLAQDGTWKSEYTLCLDYVNQLLSNEPLKKFGYYLVTRVNRVLNVCKTTKKAQSLTAADVPWPQVIQTCIDALLIWLQTLPRVSSEHLYYFEEDLSTFSEPALWRAAVMESLALAQESVTERQNEKLSHKACNLSADLEQDLKDILGISNNSQPLQLSSSFDDIEQKARLLNEKLLMEKRSCESFEKQLNSVLKEGEDTGKLVEQGTKRKCNPTWTSNSKPKALMKALEDDMPDLSSTLNQFETNLVTLQDQLKLQKRVEEFTERQLREAIWP